MRRKNYSQKVNCPQTIMTYDRNIGMHFTINVLQVSLCTFGQLNGPNGSFAFGRRDSVLKIYIYFSSAWTAITIDYDWMLHFLCEIYILKVTNKLVNNYENVQTLSNKLMAWWDVNNTNSSEMRCRRHTLNCIHNSFVMIRWFMAVLTEFVFMACDMPSSIECIE